MAAWSTSPAGSGSDSSKIALEKRERELVAAVAAGDHDAMLALHDEYYPRLFRFLHRLCGDHGVTEELVNDVMFAVWRGAGRFRGASKVSTWILGIAYRLCMKRLRRRKLRQMLRLEGREPAIDEARSIESRDLVEKALARLTVDQRVIIEFVLYLGLTYREVAELLECPVNTAKTRVFNARRRLCGLLEEMGYRGEVDRD